MNKCINPNIGNMIGRYEFNKLTTEEKQEFEAHLLKCDYCFQELYEFSTAVEIIKDNINDFRKVIHKKKSLNYILNKLVTAILPRPIRPFAPVISFAVLTTIILSISWLIFRPLSDSNLQLITEKESKQIQLQKPEHLELKGSKEEYIESNSLVDVLSSTMHVQKSSDKAHVIFSWGSVKEIQGYSIKLITKLDTIRITPFEGIQDTIYCYPLDKLETNVSYTWDLSGKLSNNESIHARKQINFNLIGE